MDNTNFDDGFYNPETELNDKYSNEIHMHRINRGTRKHDIIITGLIFNSGEQSKEFLFAVKSKFGITGCTKLMPEYDEKNKVFIFSGDKRDGIKNILVETYGRDEDFIKYHG
jgi:hypothetical protein